MGEHLSSRADVARLFGRAAFGATRSDLDRWEGRPYADAVEHLLNTPAGGSNDIDRILYELTPALGQVWWLNRMLTTAHPLEERMTLFWHDHFATAFPKVRGDELVVQNHKIRDHALGNFRSLVNEMTVDPAMLRWLDGNVSVAEAPNENFSREFFELFTLGTFPRVFSETDVREAARAFTGWTTNGLIGDLQLAQFRAAHHDTGTKTILGETVGNHGHSEYRSVVDIALRQPIAPRFIAYKMVQNFAYQPVTVDLVASPDPLVDDVAAALANSDWDIRAGMRALLLSDRFRYPDPATGRQVVRQPIEIAIHAMKALKLIRLLDLGLVNKLRRAGQVPFEPPHVGGWQLGAAWLNPSGYLGLYECTHSAVQWRNVLDPLRLLMPTPKSSDIDRGGHAWAATMGLDALSPTTLATIRAYLDSGESGNAAQQADGIFLLIANSPDWQVM